MWNLETTMRGDEIDAALRTLETRRGASNDNAMRVAAEMIAGVRARGDAFVREQIARFDGVALDEILITPREVSIDPAMRDARDFDLVAPRQAFFRVVGDRLCQTGA